jgi:ATP-binding cassette, subfamily F, member 3
LKADVWRDHLLKEEAALNAKLSDLEAEGDEKRFEDAREELSLRLQEVHTRLSDMDAASGPARAAALLAGSLLTSSSHIHSSDIASRFIMTGLGFDEADQQRPTRSFSGGWR